MVGGEGRREGHDAVDVVVDGLAVPGQDLGANLDACAIGRAVGRHKVDDGAAVLDVTDGNTHAAARRLDKVLADERRVEVAIRDGPDEIAQRTAVGQRVVVGLGLLEARAVFGNLGIPVDSLEIGEGVFAAEEIDHGIEGADVAEAGEVIERRAGRFDQFHLWAGRAVESKRIGVHVDHGVAGRQTHNGIVLGEELAVLAETAGEALLVIRRPHDVLAADNLALATGRILGARGGEGRAPATAALVALLQERIAKGVGPIGDGKGHDAGIFLAVIVHVAQAALRLDGQGQGVVEGRIEEIAHDLAEHLRRLREEEAFIAVDEAGLIFQHNDRLGHAQRNERVGVVHLAGDDDRTAFIVDDVGGCDVTVLGKGCRRDEHGRHHQQQSSKQPKLSVHGILLGRSE